jgi:hypothetical protein
VFPDDGENWEVLYDAADEGLRVAKARGVRPA